MRVLGIDPGLRLTGYAVLECAADEPGGNGHSSVPAVIEAGVIRLSPKQSVAERLVELERDLVDLIARTSPERVCVEKVYSHYAHPMTGVIMAHARGVVLLTAQRAGLELLELPPNEVKKSLTGNGHASKVQVQRTIAGVLNLAAPPEPPDVADAMAIALCGAGRIGSAILG